MLFKKRYEIMFNIGICMENQTEREKLYSKIRKWIEKRKSAFTVFQYANGKEILNSESGLPDCLFVMDVIAKKESGLLSDIRSKKGKMLLIHIGQKSGYDNGLFWDELPDMENKELLFEILGRAFCNYLSDEESFVFYSRPQYIRQPLQNIMYFLSDRRKIIMNCTNGSYEFYQKLDSIETEVLDKKQQFVRMHQSYLVNTDYIKKYSDKEVFLKNGEILTISQARKRYTKSILRSLVTI